MAGQGLDDDTAFLKSFRQMAVGVINVLIFSILAADGGACVDTTHCGCLCLAHLCPLLLLLSLGAAL